MMNLKKLILTILMVILSMGVVMAQTVSPPVTVSTPTIGAGLNSALGADVLGAHNGYGRGCVMCHAPHSGAAGNGITTTDTQNGMYALWGENLQPYFGKTYNFSGDGKASYPVTLPTTVGAGGVHDANTIILLCLSCHDGATAPTGMMKGQTVEVLPVAGGTAPTWLGNQAPSGGAAYNNDHPVGGYAVVGCTTGGTAPTGGTYAGSTLPSAPNSSHNWNCTGGGTTPISWTGSAAMTAFVTYNYPASLWNGSSGKLASFGGSGGIVTAVTCTTCHDQHSMTVYTNPVTGVSYPTMFFIRGEYAPSTGGNSVAQFCRNCHGGESNEMNGLMNVPTT